MLRGSETLPQQDVFLDRLLPGENHCHCPYEGFADEYWDSAGSPSVAWSYPTRIRRWHASKTGLRSATNLWTLRSRASSSPGLDPSSATPRTDPGKNDFVRWGSCAFQPHRMAVS